MTMTKQILILWFLSLFAVTVEGDIRKPLGLKMCIKLWEFLAKCPAPTYNTKHLFCNFTKASETFSTVPTAQTTQESTTTVIYEDGCYEIQPSFRFTVSQATVAGPSSVAIPAQDHIFDRDRRRVNPGDVLKVDRLRCYVIYIGHQYAVHQSHHSHRKGQKVKLPKNGFKKFTLRR